MLKNSAFSIVIFHILVKYCEASLPEDIANTSTECLTNSLETSLYCRGTRVINNIINNLSKTDKPIVIVRGLEIVPTNGYNPNDNHNNISTNHDNDKNNNNNNNNNNDNKGEEGVIDDTFLGRFSQYLRTHELNIKFSDLMSTDESEGLLARDLEQNGMQMSPLDESRKKDKGNGMIMALGLMMSKMMAVMGLGGIGALAMKALGVAMTALMMAAMVGVKSLANQGHESSHSVQYVTADGHHHRRRRRRSNFNNNNNIATGLQSTMIPSAEVKMELPSLAYRGWQKQ
ncbi:osiris 5 [Cochliomyia hominivorax]